MIFSSSINSFGSKCRAIWVANYSQNQKNSFKTMELFLPISQQYKPTDSKLES